MKTVDFWNICAPSSLNKWNSYNTHHKSLQQEPPMWKTWNSTEISPWNSMEDKDINFHGIPWKFLHRFPRKIFAWRIRTFPMENIRNRTPISMQIPASTFSMKFHGKVPCNSRETTPSIIPWISREFHGIHRNYTFKISSESNGIRNRFWSTAIY